MKKYTKNTTLEELLKDKDALKILEKFNIPCLSCPFASMEMGKLKIGDIANFYGIDIEKLLKELNE